MLKMNFGEDFISWIAMLHKGASTRLILSGLSKQIQLLFSIRQGDPMAMLLYIVYIEPLLATLEAKIKGLRIENFVQKSKAFCDDVNLLTEHLDGFLVVKNVVNKFYMTSGAIVSRNRKCKVILALVLCMEKKTGHWLG